MEDRQRRSPRCQFGHEVGASVCVGKVLQLPRRQSLQKNTLKVISVVTDAFPTVLRMTFRRDLLGVPGF
jgi:hypothetical protein